MQLPNYSTYKEFYDLVSTFNNILGHNDTIGPKAGYNKDMIALRRSLITEEAKEIQDSLRESSDFGVVDGLCDLLVVTFGAVGAVEEASFDTVYKYAEVDIDFSYPEKYSLGYVNRIRSRAQDAEPEEFVPLAAKTMLVFDNYARNKKKWFLYNNFREVMNSNLSKVGETMDSVLEAQRGYRDKGISTQVRRAYDAYGEHIGWCLYREDGKVLKPTTYFEPDIMIGVSKENTYG